MLGSLRSLVRAARPVIQSRWDSAIFNLRLMSIRRGLTSNSGFDPPTDSDFEDILKSSSSPRPASVRPVSDDMVYKNAISKIQNANPKLAALARPHAEKLLKTHGIDGLAAALYCIAHPKRSERQDDWGRDGGSGERRFSGRRFSGGGFGGRRSYDRYGGGERRQNRGGFDRDRSNSGFDRDRSNSGFEWKGSKPEY